jgi:MoaA/NifB/PqqE/SkfB family radical SAM enzyme
MHLPMRSFSQPSGGCISRVEFYTSGLGRIIFNVQGSSASVHEQITRTENSFDCVTRSIQIAKQAQLWVGVHFVPMKPNQHDLEAVVELCSKLCVDEVAIFRFVPQGRGAHYRSALELSRTELLGVGRRVLKLKSRYRVPRIRTGSPMNFLSEVDEAYRPIRCNAGRSTCNITADGHVVPCPAFKRVTGFSVGNILTRSLTEVWEQHPVLDLLRRRTDEAVDGECFAQIVTALPNQQTSE